MPTGLTARDLKAALPVLGEIGVGCPTPGEFARRGVRLLPSLVASEITTLSLCDLVAGRRRVVSYPVHVLGRDALAAFDLGLCAFGHANFHGLFRHDGEQASQVPLRPPPFHPHQPRR